MFTNASGAGADSRSVSVVIPCYNQGRFLGEAIESVLQQTHRASDITVVDDGSIDDTPEVAARYPQVRYVRQRNRGVSAARNAGLSKTFSSYVVFLDADDRLTPTAFEREVEYLHTHPKCAFAYGYTRLIWADGDALPSSEQPWIEMGDPTPTPFSYIELLRGNPIWTPGAVMYRRSIFESAAAFIGRYTPCDDYELNTRLARQYEIGCTGSIVVEYRQHESKMSGDMIRMLEGAMTVWRMQRPHANASREHINALREGILGVQSDYGETVVRYVQSSLRSRRWRQALRGWFALVRYYPRGALKVIGDPGPQ